MAKDADNWMPLWIGDYMADTMHLTTEQHGAYLLLLMHQWRKGSIPDDDAVLAATTRLPMPRWRACRAVIAAFFSIAGGSWTQKRAQYERERADKITGKRSDSGKAGAAARWQTHGKDDGKCMANAMANAMANGWQDDAPSPSPSQKDSPSLRSGGRRGKRASPTKTPIPADFQASEGVRKWAVVNQFDRVDEHTVAFVETCTANGYVYADHDAALKKAIRQDWARLRVAGPAQVDAMKLQREVEAEMEAAHAAG